MDKNNKIQVAIISKQYLLRFGIKTLLGAIGIEPDLFEANTFKKIKLHMEELFKWLALYQKLENYFG